MRATAAVLCFLVLAGCSGPRPTTAIRDRADFLFQQQEYTAAADEYAEITERYPGDWRAHYMLGRCQLAVDLPADARRNLRIAHAGNPDAPEVVDALAEALFRLDREEQLYTLLRERAASEGTVRAWLRLGRYAAEMGDADTAREAYDTAIAVDDGRSVEPYLRAASFAEELGDMDEAVRRLRQAYGVDPDDPRVARRLRELGEVPGPTIALPPGT